MDISVFYCGNEVIRTCFFHAAYSGIRDMVEADCLADDIAMTFKGEPYGWSRFDLYPETLAG